MKWIFCYLTTIFLLAQSGISAFGQTTEPANLYGDSTQTRKRLAEAEQKLLAGKTADATDDLQRILDEAGTDLITIDGKSFQTAQWMAQKILAKLPSEALKNYRDQIETSARKLLETAKRTREPATLWQLLDKYFVSRPADEGSLMLGDILFERGEFHSAELVWNRLIPDNHADVVYPNSKSDPAQVRARIILAAIFQGELERAKAELAAFKARYPESRGPIAGKSGLLATILSEQFNAPPKISLSRNSGTDWPTFGGSPDHSASVGIRLPVDWDNKCEWVKTLSEDINRADPFRRRIRKPFGHPIVANGQVFVTDGFTLKGFDLFTGIPTFPTIELSNAEKTAEICPTLTAAEGKLYVRIGPTHFKKVPDKIIKSEIRCYELKTGNSNGVELLWRVEPPPGDQNSTVIWEGAPQVYGRRMWAAYARFEGGRIVQGIACFDPSDSMVKRDHEGPKWSFDVCDSQISSTSDSRTRQELITLVGSKVVFCSNTGVVVALNSVTGNRSWAFRYQRRSKSNLNRTADPAPAVAYGGRVFVAPVDADKVYALDAESGAPLWESEQMEGAQIVGVTDGKLVVSTTGQVHGIRGLNVADGSQRDPGGWIDSVWNGPQRQGRGFVTDDRIFWPTVEGLQLRYSKDGEPGVFPLQPPAGSLGGVSGNIIYAKGMLVVVTADRIWAYRSYEFSDEKILSLPGSKSERETNHLQFKRFSTQTELLLADGKLDLARKTLLQACRSTLPANYRAWAAARLLLLTPTASSEKQIPDDLREVLSPELLQEWVFQGNGTPATLAEILQQHLARKSTESHPWSNVSLVEDANPIETPGLDADAEIERTVRLPTGTAPLQWIPGTRNHRCIYLSASNELLSYSLTKGEETRYHSVAVFTHIAELTEGFIAAGPLCIAIYGNDRAPKWLFRVPVTDSLPERPGEYRSFTHDMPVQPELTTFHLSGSSLIALLGDRHLIAFDLQNRRVRWVLCSNKKNGYHPAHCKESLRFFPDFFVNSHFIVVQLSDARRWIIEIEKCRILNVPGFGLETARVRWLLPPAAVGMNYLAVSDGPALIRLLNLSLGRVKWTFSDQQRTSSLTGEPAQIRNWDELLLVAVRRNHGVEIDRVDPRNGKSVWAGGTVFLDSNQLRLADADADGERAYLPIGNSLIAIELKTGKVSWEAELPELHGVAGWVVRAGRNCAIVYPLSAIPREDPVEVARRMLRTFQNNPEMWRLPAMAFGLYDAWIARSFPILMLDPESGRRLRTIEIPAKGPVVTVCFEGERTVVGTGDRICWIK